MTPRPPRTRARSWLFPRIDGRFNRRLSAWFLVFALLPVLVATDVGYERTAAIIAGLAERFLSAYVRLQAQHVSDRTQDRLQALAAMSTGNEVLNAPLRATATARVSTDSLRRYLGRRRVALRAFDILSVYRGSGALVVSTDTTGVVTLTMRPPLSRTVAEFDGGTDGDGMARRLRLVVPVLAADSTLLGYVVGIVGHAGAVSLLQIPEVRDGAIDGLLFDVDQRALVSSISTSTLGTRAEFLQQLLTMPTGSVQPYVDGAGRERIAAVADIPMSTWRLVTEVSADDVLRPLRQLGWLPLMLGVLMVGALVVAAVFVAREIVEPVQQLAVAAGHVAGGDLHVRLPVHGHDEITELGHAFNAMTRSLEQATHRVDEMHEREIERASQLATVGELASGLAHEIKNPVIGVTNGLDLVRKRIGHDTALEPILDEMHRELERIAFTVQDLLSFARPATPLIGRVGVNQIAERAARLIQPAAVQAGVALDVVPCDDEPPVDADERMLYQALVNLLMNAVQATPSGGRVSLSAYVDGDSIAFEVRDTGRGIPPDVMANVFRPFFTTRHTGTGLGLSITRALAERHGGSVQLESTEQVGTTATMRLPLVATPQALEPIGV